MVPETNNKLFILGAGSQGGKAAVLANMLGLSVEGFVSTEPAGTIKHGLPVLGTIQTLPDLFQDPKNSFHIAIGEPFYRKVTANSLADSGTPMVYPTLMHPSAYLAPGTKIGEGTFVGVRAILENESETGIHCIIDSGAIVEHNCLIGNYVNISPGATLAGNVKVGSGTIIGVGAIIREKVTIGANALIGAGAVVVNDVPDFAVVAGIPAKVLRYREESSKNLK